jgi:ABC-2 type transport system permease protein
MLVAAHLVVQFIVVTIAAATAILFGMLVFGLAFPANLAWFLVSFVLGAGCLLGVGVLIGAVVPTASSGQALGLLAYFPLLFFGGVYVPLEVMSDGLRTVSGYTPSGAAVQALSASWAGDVPEASSLIAMTLFLLISASLSTWLFRWD